ncbi:MAG TPA: TonB-dependent receptor plug domain-containing protein [Gemmatimonadales bacterium]|nr:TonB-dependent receptor plug domain-containing protein [Gemmatimonadales bacterium]
MRHSLVHRTPLLGALLVAASGALAAQQTGGPRSPDVITAEQVEAALATTAYEAVEKIRPGFLRRAERPQTVYGGRRGTPDIAPIGRGRETERMFATDRSSLDATENDVGRSGASAVVVYLNGTRVGGVQELKRIPSQDVREIRFLSASDATQQYGAGHAAGAIQVTLKST